MTGKRRLDSVVRIRELQSRIAEAEAVRCRLVVDRRRVAVDQAVEELDQRAASADVDSLTSLLRSRRVLDDAVVQVQTRSHDLVTASTGFDGARQAWHEAHRRHDAVERLDDRLRVLEDEEAMRKEQAELDELVVVRHGRKTTGFEEDQ